MDGQQFVTMGKDRQIRVFRFLTGKLHRKYDESLAFLNKIQKVPDLHITLENHHTQLYVFVRNFPGNF